MIHQLIFANPKPEMSATEFQDYWIHVHAKNFASKIPQIKKYKVNRILQLDEKPIYNGMAEIWLENEEEQLKSLQSSEFINGARADEPNWAAFWESLCLDTYLTPIIDDCGKYRDKIVILVKRKNGVPLEMFRKYSFDTLRNPIEKLENVKGAALCIVKDNAYAVGESRFDTAYHIWFESLDTIKAVRLSERYKELMEELRSVSSCNGMFEFVSQENIII